MANWTEKDRYEASWGDWYVQISIGKLSEMYPKSVIRYGSYRRQS